MQTLYRRSIIALLWFLFLAVVYGWNRKTTAEYEAETDLEYGDIITNDPVLQGIYQQTNARLATPEGQKLQRDVRYHQAKRAMKTLIEGAFEDES
ncbi:MAG: hypothetical protein SF029_23990 [bacterium]|nr:hypothetical protein [bacterium]